MIFFLFIVIVVLTILWLTSRNKLKSDIKLLNIKLIYAEGSKTSLDKRILELEQDIIQLDKYRGLLDVEVKIQEMLADAEMEAYIMLKDAKKDLNEAIEEASNIKIQAQKELNEAKVSAKAIRAQADIDATATKQNAINILDNAIQDAKIIVIKAEGEAKEIAGDAYDALKHAAELEKTAKAMKNIIQGYGDQYLIPTYSLLDDLAEEFSHTDAGEKLKFAREKTRLMIQNGLSAQCDYVETNRKETAINFILDAFNGKVDSILSKVKKDNYGTLEQKIKDAFQIVNNNGKAFRNAVITIEYLHARLDELKWAIITQELKWEEQEEQRRIKEQIREEEKARREFEKAMRDAQKEEESLKKLIDKAQREILQASEEQKAKYEEKLRELEGKLQVAEEKNQRAISMAQQTKSGNVYIISNIGSFGENVYKIGMTRRLEPLDRIRELGDASVPFEFDVHSMIYSENAPNLERELHKKFLRLQMNKVNPRKEFFKVSLTDIKAEVDSMDINAKWTMTADARQYRESLAIEDEIRNDKQKQLEWESYQLQADPVSVEEEVEI